MIIIVTLNMDRINNMTAAILQFCCIWVWLCINIQVDYSWILQNRQNDWMLIQSSFFLFYFYFIFYYFLTLLLKLFPPVFPPSAMETIVIQNGQLCWNIKLCTNENRIKPEAKTILGQIRLFCQNSLFLSCFHKYKTCYFNKAGCLVPL